MMNTVILLCTFAILLCSAHSALDHQCVYDMMHPPGYMEKWNSKSKRNAQPISYAASPPAAPSNSAPIRIKFDYSNIEQTAFNKQWTCFDGVSSVSLYDEPQKIPCSKNLLFNSSREANLRQFLKDAEAILTNTLSVIPVVGNLNLNVDGATPCSHNEYIVPSEYYTPGQGASNTDIIILVSAHPGPIDSSGAALPVIAFGISCDLDQNDRPILGMLNFVPTYLDTSPDLYNTRLYTAVHEITHVLGFNSGTFASQGMLDDDTDNHYADGSTASFQVINTTKVTAYTRNYFGCDDMKGAPIEDNGGTGTAGSHWKKRVFMDEYMIGNAINTPIFSELSLAWFEDTGFYVSNYSNAQKMQWGRGQGCNFVKQKCSEWNSDYICTESQNTNFGCSADMKQKAQCQVGQVTNSDPHVPSIFQYYDGNVTGPFDALQDYCPIPVPLYACSFTSSPGQISSVAGLTDAIDRGEQNGFTDSRCFTSTVVKGLATGVPKAPVCYRTYCTSPSTLKVGLNNIWYDCPAGTDIEVIIYSGKVSCPSNIARVCGGAPIDDTWPVWKSVSPSEGEPGTTVTITGVKFTNGSSVSTSGGPTKNVQIISDTTIVVTLPNYGDIENPSSLLKQTFSIWVTDKQGRTAVGYHSFTVDIKLNANLLNAIGSWIKGHWYVVAIFGVVVIVLSVAIRKCCKEKKPEGYDSDA